MGCGASAAPVARQESYASDGRTEDDMGQVGSVPPVEYNEASAIDQKETRRIYERLEKLQELDQATKVPFILVELTGEGPGDGEIEVCGKDEYGVYEALDGFFTGEWNCEKLDAGDLTPDTKVPFCKAQYRWPGFQTSGEEGLNNMGLMTMRLIDFMSGSLSWTLAVVNGGNVGVKGEVRETQIVFKAPHPMNLVAPHMMIELRSAGFIEVCADMEEDHLPILESIESYFKDRFRAQRISGHEEFCDRYYKAGEGIFRGVAGSPECNFGLLCIDVCDRVVSENGWSLVACNAGNYGEASEHQEQQLVFRRDYHPLGDAKYLQVILNEAGNIEVNGKRQREIHAELGNFLTRRMKCEQAGQIYEGETMCRLYAWQLKNPDMLRAAADVTSFFENKGWELQVSGQQIVQEEAQKVREQQLIFRPGKTAVGTIEPHLFIELYAGEGKEEFYENEEHTQVLANQRIRLRAIGPPKGSLTEKLDETLLALDSWFVDYLDGSSAADEEPSPGTRVYKCNVFLCRGKFENNLAQWTMRICDFLVDQHGWNFVVCSLCNMGDAGQFRLQQLVFHYDGEKRAIPVSMQSSNMQDASRWTDTPLPDHWMIEDVVNRKTVHKIVPVTSVHDKRGLQALCDASFKRVLTRDRKPDDEAPDEEEMPYRLEIVQVFRSEHAELHARYEKYIREGRKNKRFEIKNQFRVKTHGISRMHDSQLMMGDSYLFHGTNPSSAISILQTGFILDHAGTTTGTMYGPGIYMAECSSKSDEYSRDDGGNNYPSLHAILVCRCYVGKPLVVDSAGPHVDTAREQGLDCVCGDREAKAGTYREFVFFNETQVYPEYAIIYRRNYDRRTVPEHMRVPTKGTTGRFWIFKTPDGWRNLPTEVNKMLMEAERDGSNVITVNLGGTEYTFDAANKIGTNTKTGNTVPMKPPMVR